MSTLRQRLEAIRERHGATLANQDDFLTYSDAEAALAILDAAELISEYAGGDATEKTHWRYVPDPEPSA